MVAQQKAVKDHKLVILLKNHSEIVKFIIDLRLKWRVDRKKHADPLLFSISKECVTERSAIKLVNFHFTKRFQVIFSVYKWF